MILLKTPRAACISQNRTTSLSPSASHQASATARSTCRMHAPRNRRVGRPTATGPSRLSARPRAVDFLLPALPARAEIIPPRLVYDAVRPAPPPPRLAEGSTVRSHSPRRACHRCCWFLSDFVLWLTCKQRKREISLLTRYGVRISSSNSCGDIVRGVPSIATR